MLRLITYNVRRFVRDDGTACVDAMVALLRSATPGNTVVCLNEVWAADGRLATVADALGMQSFFTQSNPTFPNYGNALLVSPALNPKHHRSVELPGGTVFRFPGTSKPKKRVIRGACVVDIDVPQQGRMAVVGTHLDHISDKERQVQGEHVMGLAANGTLAPAHIIMGDLNAIQRADYNDNEWAALEQRHASNKWPPPEQSVLMTAFADAQYSDLFAEGKAGSVNSQNSIDYDSDSVHEDNSNRSSGHTSSNVTTQAPVLNGARVSLSDVPSREKLTAHGAYRIDYVLASPALMKEGARVDGARLLDGGGLSDHKPVSVDLTFTPL